MRMNYPSFANAVSPVEVFHEVGQKLSNVGNGDEQQWDPEQTKHDTENATRRCLRNKMPVA